MSALEAFESIVGSLVGEDYKDAVISLLVILLSVVGFKTANDWINHFAEGPKPASQNGGRRHHQTSTKEDVSRDNHQTTSHSQEKKKGFNPRKGLRTLVLGYMALGVSKVCRMALSHPPVLDQVDSILDGCQAKLRSLVVSTTTLKDDELLDQLDGLLDGIQSRLRHKLREAIKE